MKPKSKRVLFVCTGNYYRSRYAEAVFNHVARALDLDWAAFSRGLNIHAVEDGELSPWTRAELDRLGIPLSLTGPCRVALAEQDLHEAVHTIALKETEHRPMMRTQFPVWAQQIRYWEIHDLDCSTADESLPRLHEKVRALADDLAAFDRAGVT